MNNRKFKWNYFKIATVIFAAIYGMVVNIIQNPTNVIHLGSLNLFFIFIVTLLALVFIIGLQFINKRSAKVWSVPSWFHNPFNFKQPLNFFHFVSFICLANGISSFVIALIIGSSEFSILLLPLVIGLGLLIGIHLSLILFASKVEKSKGFEEIYRIF